MLKQAIGFTYDNVSERTDTTLYTLHYPQKMVVGTAMSREQPIAELPFGINVVLAILSESGFNQEDSCIIHKAAIDRGLFVSTTLTTHCEEEQSADAKIARPPLEAQRADRTYSHLSARGLPPLGHVLADGDVIIGKWVQESEKKARDASLVTRRGPCIVTRVVDTFSEGNQRVVKVITRELNIPEIGDKFSSVISQKGVCGMITATQDMPFTSQGIVPDIFINPHALPSRMTVSQLVDMVMGKAALLEGKLVDASAFASSHPSDYESVLNKYGFARSGSEDMYSGVHGRPFECSIFVGPAYYMRLTHLVSGKAHARDGGVVTALTRAPPEGRRRDGGLKFGEMEKDALLAHGATQMLLERLFKYADDFSTEVCSACGDIVYGSSCWSCNVPTVTVAMPYIFKLIKHELGAMNLRLELHVE
jgi:DNA-directed RNA polymerase beta subunit